MNPSRRCANTASIVVGVYREPPETKSFVLESVAPELENGALQMFWGYHDKEWSVVDCCGFQLMIDRQILYAFAADHHFEQAGRSPLIELAPGGWRKSYSYLYLD